MSKDSLKTLHQILRRHSETGETEELDLKAVVEDVRVLSGAEYVVFNEVTHNEQSTTTRVISGMGDRISRAAEILGFPLIGSSYSLDPEILSVFQQSGLVEFPSLCVLAASQIPKPLCARLIQLFRVGRAYGIGLKKGDELMADLIFIMKKGKEIQAREEVELFALYLEAFLQKQAVAETSVLKVLSSIEGDQNTHAPLMQALFKATDRIPDMVYQLDREGCFTFVNQAVQRYGYTREELIGRSILDIVHPDDRERAYWPVRERRTGERKTRKFEVRLLTGSKRTAFFKLNETTATNIPVLEIHAEGLYESQERNTCFQGTIGIGRDVTAEKELHLKLDRQAQIFRVMAENVGEAVWLEKQNPYKVYYLNPAAERIFFGSRNTIDCKPGEWLKSLHPEDRSRVKEYLGKTQAMDEMRELEYRILDEDGEIHWVLSRLYPVYQNGKLTNKCVGIATDTTRQNVEREKLVNLVELEKSYLREMNHRVKNNLAMIDGMLNLELNALAEDQEEARNVLMKVSGRIQAVTRVHEMLAGVSEGGMVNASDYLQSLAHSLFSTNCNGSDGISPDYRMENDIRFPVGMIIPLGMILNELIINALKYAFPENGGGTILVTFKKLSEHRYILSVGDDGAPLPENGSLQQNTGGIGMELVHALVRQLRGDFEVERKTGFKTFKVSFPEPETTESSL